MNAPERAEAQSGDHGYGRAGPHAPGGDSNNQLAREPFSYGGEAVPTPGGLEGRTPNPPSADTAASYGGIAVDGQAEVCQNGQSRGEPAANPGEAGETVPPSGDATVLKDEHGAVLDTLPTVAMKINAFFERAAKTDAKAETYRISAGQELAKAKARVDAGEAGKITWEAWCAENVQRSEGDIRKILAIANAADPAKAAAAERQRNREAVARHRRAYVSAASDRSGDGTGGGDLDVTKSPRVTLETVKRDIQLLSADALVKFDEWYLEWRAARADEKSTSAEEIEPGQNDKPQAPGHVSATTSLDGVAPTTAASVGEFAPNGPPDHTLAPIEDSEQSPQETDPDEEASEAPATSPLGSPQPAATADLVAQRRTPADTLAGLQ